MLKKLADAVFISYESKSFHSKHMVYHQWEFYPLIVTLSYRLFGIFIEAQNLDMYPRMRCGIYEVA
jgi:hypothetical protein